MKFTIKRFVSLCLSLLILLNIIVFAIPVSAFAATSDIDYTYLDSQIDKATYFRNTEAKKYIKYAIKRYIDSDSRLYEDLFTNKRRITFVFEGASTKYTSLYNADRNQALMLVIGLESSKKPKITAYSSYFSTLPDDPWAIGKYQQSNYLGSDPNKKYCGSGILVDGIYHFEKHSSSNYKYTSRKLENTYSVYFTPEGSYKVLKATDILIHDKANSTPQIVHDKSGTQYKAKSIGCITYNREQYNINESNRIPVSGYVVVNRMLFQNVLSLWFEDSDHWADTVAKEALNTVLKDSKIRVPKTNAATPNIQIYPNSLNYQIIKGNSCAISGTIISKYNLKEVIGYMDGEQYVKITSFSSSKKCDIGADKGLDSFKASKLSAGYHTLKIYAKDVNENTATQTIRIIVTKTDGTLNASIAPPSDSTSNNSSSVVYFKKCDSKYTGIIDALKSIGAESSYAYRKTIAAANNITGYSGTSAQNSQMLKLLKEGKLIKP